MNTKSTTTTSAPGARDLFGSKAAQKSLEQSMTADLIAVEPARASVSLIVLSIQVRC